MCKGDRFKAAHQNRKLKIEGKKFNNLTVLYEDGRSKSNSFTYTCRCDCGKELKNVVAYEVAKGRRKSCGCNSRSNSPDRKEILKSRILSRTEENGSCWEWKGFVSKLGYGHIKIKKKTCLAHRVSFEVFLNEIPEKMLVLHICDNRKCVNPDHLFLGSHSENTQDMCKKNRQPGHGKITQEMVKSIREEYKEMNMVELSRKYNVSEFCIFKIIHKATWKYV